jgi:L-fucose isomerase-like protein
LCGKFGENDIQKIKAAGMLAKPTLGVIVGNRSFFPDRLADEGRKTILQVLQEEGINAIALAPEDSKFGSVESDTDAHKLAALFKKRRDEIDGVLITSLTLAKSAQLRTHCAGRI